MVKQFANKKYKLQSSDKFDEYMKALGVNEELRKLGNTLTPVLELLVNGDTYTLKSTTPVKNHEFTFKLGEEFSEDTVDGRKVKSVIIQDGNKLIQTQKGDKGTNTITREFSADTVKITLKVGDVVATRIHKIE